jgi:hypothetical protein
MGRKDTIQILDVAEERDERYCVFTHKLFYC